MSLYDQMINNEYPAQSFGTVFDRITIEKRFMLNCVFELTPVCNFRCPFCYARISPEELKNRHDTILSFEQWKEKIDELCDMGVLNLTLTGGECMIHPDFCKIYEYAYNKGLVISIMSNASLITEQIFTLLSEKPPLRIYITVYGANAETYAAVCGNASFFDTVTNNIKRLKTLKIPVVIQFTSDKDNIKDLENVYCFSKEVDAPFRYSRVLAQFGRCTLEIIDDNCAAEDDFVELSKRIWLDERNLTEEEYEHIPKRSVTPVLDNPIIEKGVPCNAGRNSSFISHNGTMQPCVMIDAFTQNTNIMSIKDCWEATVKWADGVKRLTDCTNCLFAMKCKQCIALHYNDTHEFGKPSERLCYKKLYPEKAKALEEKYKRNGYFVVGVDV